MRILMLALHERLLGCWDWSQACGDLRSGWGNTTRDRRMATNGWPVRAPLCVHVHIKALARRRHRVSCQRVEDVYHDVKPVALATSPNALASMGCSSLFLPCFSRHETTRYHLISLECKVNSVFLTWPRLFMFCPIWVGRLVVSFVVEQSKTRQNTWS